MEAERSAAASNQESPRYRCWYCLKEFQEIAEYAVEPPDEVTGLEQVPLCKKCGGHAFPSIMEIDERIKNYDPLLVGVLQSYKPEYMKAVLPLAF